jgi:hypothetical protein
MTLIRRHESGRAVSAKGMLRLRVWCRRARLDRRLANGEDGSSDPALALRGEQLCSDELRCSLAGTLAALVDVIDERPSPYESPRLDRGAIFQNRTLLLELAGRLRGDDWIDPSGVALAGRLVANTAGPLYVSDADILTDHCLRPSLAAELRRAIAALDGPLAPAL